ncbi:MAG: hypothetical protein LBP87_01695 [Planctomycetaceae bacterium]|jgi:hypothetical protein|nr:hypothetical protein [Planctomycetaceae bacterium]
MKPIIKKPIIKRILFWFLLVFIISAILTQITLRFRCQETVEIPDGFNVIFCHARVRCQACIKMEALVRRTLFEIENHSGSKFQLTTLEYDIPANQTFAKQFHIGTATVILLEQKNGKTLWSRNLTTEVWKQLNNETSFVEMLKNELKNNRVNQEQ